MKSYSKVLSRLFAFDGASSLLASSNVFILGAVLTDSHLKHLRGDVGRLRFYAKSPNELMQETLQGRIKE